MVTSYSLAARSDVAADIGDHARSAGGMDAAVGLLRSRPAAGAGVLALFHRRGAGPYAERRIAASHQRMRRQVMFGGVSVALFLPSTGQGIELQLAFGFLHHLQAKALGILESLA